MEEVVHVMLGHEPTRVVLGPNGLAFREYHKAKEEVAYGVGAAALVPYAALFPAITSGQPPESVARHFGVSPELVIYRIKITMLWPQYKCKAG
jgi:hypothetical protein